MRLSPLLFAALAVVACSDDPETSQSGRGASSSSSSGNTSSGGGGGGGESGDGTAAQLCVDTINAYRKERGLPAYTRWTEAEACADGQAKSDASTKKAHGAFGRCKEMGQNECPGWPGPTDTMIPKCLEMMWNEGPGGGHHDSMASTRFTKVACGFATAADGKIWSVQDFR